MKKSECLITEEGRECTCCGVFKKWEGYHKDKTSSTGHGTQCKVCKNKKDAKRRRSQGMNIRSEYEVDEHGRECTCCGEYKLYAEFYKDKNGINSYDSRCKLCTNTINTEKRRLAGMKPLSESKIDDDGRECSECGIYKLWKGFNKQTTGINGHSNNCRVCAAKRHSEWYKKSTKNKKSRRDIAQEKYSIDEYGRKCTECGVYKFWENFYAQKTGIHEHTAKCKSKKTKRHKKYQEEHREEANKRDRDRRKNDPEYRLKDILRRRLHDALTSQNAKKFDHTMDLIGCTPKFLLNHLNTVASNGLKFEDKEIQVDHIIPCAAFNLQDELEQLVCFNWRNCQLLTATDNSSKNDKLPINAEELRNEIKEEVLKERPHLANTV